VLVKIQSCDIACAVLNKTYFDADFKEHLKQYFYQEKWMVDY